MKTPRRVLASGYGLGVKARDRAYDLGLRPVHRIDGLKVVSVGGITAGGSGKTPLTQLVARELARRGAAVAIVSRGYRGSWERTGGVVSDGSGVLRCSVAEAGDEAWMLAWANPEIPVVVGADRVAAAAKAKALGALVVVLDSGFQHRRLGRDLDIVTIDRTCNGAPDLLPFGPLREPLGALERAHLIARLDEVGDANEPRASFVFRLVPEGLFTTNLERAGELDELCGRRVFLVAGIARPERFARSVRQIGARVVGTRWYRDHHLFTRRDRRWIEGEARARGAELVLTTEKDLVRLGELSGAEVSGLRVVATVSAGEALLRDRLAELV